jgi:GTPase SAR1 family protein
MLASGSEDTTVRIWSVETEQLHQNLSRHYDDVRDVAWSPDGQLLASGGDDRNILLWQVETGTLQHILTGHTQAINSLVWSPDGQLLASGADDATIRIWDGTREESLRLLTGHTEKIFCVDWSPDGQYLASASLDNTIRIWNPWTGRQQFVLEGHTADITSVSFSADGHFLASKSIDHTVRIWRCGTWDTVSVLTEPSSRYWFAGLAFHPTTAMLATLGEDGQVIRIWEIDTGMLLGLQQGQALQVSSADDSAVETTIPLRSSLYTNAKVVLVGDSGVGKSGLGLVLTGWPFVPTESTHGRRVWTLENTRVNLDDQRQETREMLLWDLAGQPSYRLIHQLHLQEVAVALVVFDARSETDPFAGVKHWDRALRQAQRVRGDAALPLQKLLVAARADRGGIPVSRERLAHLVADLDFAQFFETSAKEGWQIAELGTAIRAGIDWQALPRVSSTELFQRIQEFLLAEKEAGRLLSSEDDLYATFRHIALAQTVTDDLRSQFTTCIRLVESQGLIRRFTFGNLVLLQPELLDAYASALVNAAKAEPDGLGSIAEEHARTGRFRMSDDERIHDKKQEGLLLIATVEDLLYHEIALRESSDSGPLLVFPSQLTREYPDLPDPEGKAVIFTFEGPVLNIYATLAVRLAHSGLFQKHELWKHAATYTARVGGTCGMALREIEEGRGELTLFFNPDASEETRFHFEEYVWNHLRRRSLPDRVERRRVFVCTNPACGEAMTTRQVAKRRTLGHTTINCPVCDTSISLLDREERLADARSRSIHAMDEAADARRDDATAALRQEGQQVVEQRERDRGTFRQQLDRAFDVSELHTLCFDLEIDIQHLSGENKMDQVRELIAYFERRGRLSDLIAALKKWRPQINWE